MPMLQLGTEKHVVRVNLKPGLGVRHLAYTKMIRFNWIRRPVLCSPTKLQIRRFTSSYDADVAGLTEEEAEVM